MEVNIKLVLQLDANPQTPPTAPDSTTTFQIACVYLSFYKEHRIKGLDTRYYYRREWTCVQGGGGTGCVSGCTLHTLCCIVLRAVMKCIKRWQLVPSQRRWRWLVCLHVYCRQEDRWSAVTTHDVRSCHLTWTHCCHTRHGSCSTGVARWVATR